MSPLASAVWGVLVALGAGALGLVAATARGRLASLSAPALVLPVLAVLSGAALTALEQPEQLWTGDASTGDLSQYADVQTAWPQGGVVVVDDPVPDGYDQALRFIVRPGDRTFGQTEEERAEVAVADVDSYASEGETSSYAWSFLLPELPEVADKGFLSIAQFHQTGRTCPQNVSFLVVGDQLRLTLRGGDLDESTCEREHEQDFDLGPLPLDRWTDVRVDATWSTDPERGRISVRVGGEQIIEDARAANLYTGQQAYLKQGLYRTNTNQELTLHVAGVVAGDSPASVALRGCRDRSVLDLLVRHGVWC